MFRRGEFGIDMVVNDRFERCDFVDIGMPVVAPCRVDGKPQGLRCKVVVAAGYHARVVNEKVSFDHWFHIDELRIERSSENVHVSQK